MTEAEIVEWMNRLAQTDMRVLDVHGCHPHTPAPNSLRIDLWSEDADRREAARRLFEHRLRVTKQLGGDAMVYHVPCHIEPTPTVIDRFIEGLARMEDTARSLGLIVALENHFLAENDKIALAAAFERFAPDYIGFTWDPGHALVSGNSEWVVQNCLDRLHILHLNDNDTKSDRHWNPHTPNGKADWDRIIDAIAESPYRKPIQLEVRWHPDLHDTHEAFLAEAKTAAKTIAACVHNRISTMAPICTPHN